MPTAKRNLNVTLKSASTDGWLINVAQTFGTFRKPYSFANRYRRRERHGWLIIMGNSVYKRAPVLLIDVSSRKCDRQLRTAWRAACPHVQGDVIAYGNFYHPRTYFHRPADARALSNHFEARLQHCSLSLEVSWKLSRAFDGGDNFTLIFLTFLDRYKIK